MSVRRSALPLVHVAPSQLEIFAFLGIVLAVSWPLLLLPRSDVVSAVVGWVPGAAALALVLHSSTRFVRRRLALDRLGWPDAYLFAIWIPVFLVLGRIAVTVFLGAGRLDGDVGGLHPASGAAPTFEAVERLVGAIVLAPFATILLTLGTELGWRAFLLPRLLPIFGTWRAIVVTSLLWGAWQLPRVLDLRSPTWAFEAVAFLFWCLFVGEILGWLYLRTRSVWAPALFSAVLASTSYLPSLVLRDLSPDAANPFGPAALIVAAVIVLFLREGSDGEVLQAQTR